MVIASFLAVAMTDREQQLGVGPSQPGQHPGVRLVVLAVAFGDRAHLPGVRNDHLQTLLLQIPAHPGGVGPGLHDSS